MRKRLSDSVDLMDSKGSSILVGMIQHYWRARGYENVVVRRYPISGYDGLWEVRSNLVAGLPPVFEGVTPLQGEIRVGDTITYPNGRTGTVIY